MGYVLRPRNRRLASLEINALGWWFILDRISPQFQLSARRSRPPLLQRLRDKDGFQVTGLEAQLMAKIVRQNTGHLISKWPIAEQFADWAAKSDGFAIY